MSAQMNLKEIEKRAFRSTYQDGLWDIYYGLIVLCMAFFLYYPESGYSFRNILLGMLSFLAAYGLFFAGKKWITAPRLGQAVFGEVRKRKRKTLTIVMCVLIALQAALVAVTATGWLNPAFGAKLNQWLGEKNGTLLAVASIAMLMVGSGMFAIVHFSDFIRGYYIAALMALAVFLMILFNRPLYPILIGAVIIVPGVVLLVRFLKRYPLPRNEEPRE